jgi:predicted DNA-binding ribbon-helix-helix protein
MAFEDSEFQKKSVSLHGHKTSISLEKAFWSLLEASAHQEGISLTQLIQRVDENRKGNLASALRLYALAEGLRKQ